ncbi:relaxase MobL [Amycolatopsis sp. PS_44_ISF1]|uniref:relaxase MobL n=1 Tax=Amycolatopsis sp. PS_44_ISF1 TaxID=2974917 RepID=UPI0028DF6653|nr:relaxase MobL [Amycolatopsis sp. PS_44_ISF1]MDT8913572.1 relaxase MobL [Amycolatopsis sp. PS_44_ISF1]
MGLKQSVVIVNEFSVPRPGGAGSRGATPGDYVIRYMARGRATEPLAPIRRLRAEDINVRYRARESAVRHPGVSRDAAKAAMRRAQGAGGVAFGYDSISLSDEQLRAAARDIQTAFESGKTVLKTVLSFSEHFLRENGIVDQGFRYHDRGDYRGHLDQMKLRMAIRHGLDRMGAGGSGFDDLRWIGVIQVDTEHVHCHLAMFDAGTGSLMKDGTQRGKVLERHKSSLRRGIDVWLRGKQAVASLFTAADYDRRNVTTFIKRWAHERINAESLPQFALASLPADRTLWRAGSDDARMRKGNRLVTQLVTEQLERAGLPLPAAVEEVTGHIDQWRQNEDRAPQHRHQLPDRDRAKITAQAVSAVYQMLRDLPQAELRVRTPMLEVMGTDYEHMASRQHARAADSLVHFGFRLRSYAIRQRHHRTQAEVYRDLSRQWERAHERDPAAEVSRPLYDFYRFESDYHRRVMAKYQHFLPFLGNTGYWHKRLRQVTEYGRRMRSLTALRQDTSLQRMTDPVQAEQLGRDIYDQPGGGHLAGGTAGQALLDARMTTMARVYAERVEALRADLSTSGLLLRSGLTADPGSPAGHASTTMAIEAVKTHDFHQVKALDLHHLGADFVARAQVGPQSRSIFLSAAAERRRLLLGAMAYLDQSGQAEAITDLPVDDVATMAQVSRELAASARNHDGPGVLVVPSTIAELRARHQQAGPARRSAASSLGSGLAVRLQAHIDAVVTGTATVTTCIPEADDLSNSTESFSDR